MKYGHVAPDSMKARGMFTQATHDGDIIESPFLLGTKAHAKHLKYTL